MHFPTNSSSSSFDATTDENSIVREEEEDQSAVNRRQSLLSVAAVAGTSLLSAFPAKSNDAPENGVYDFTVRQYGKPFALAKYKGKVTVIVNVASE
jgi:cytochrome oxidase Cu insertion factor (SCO1/SenC/PrrC family)|tara:strand:+ start:345 stop:632 length:288 start_codon:yes stop_codon:yes gene_type:complete